jgi:hypothetical protein
VNIKFFCQIPRNKKFVQLIAYYNPTMLVYFEFSFKVGNLGKVNFKRRVRAAHGLEARLKKLKTGSQIVSYVEFSAPLSGVGGGLEFRQLAKFFGSLLSWLHYSKAFFRIGTASFFSLPRIRFVKSVDVETPNYRLQSL